MKKIHSHMAQGVAKKTYGAGQENKASRGIDDAGRGWEHLNPTESAKNCQKLPSATHRAWAVIAIVREGRVTPKRK